MKKYILTLFFLVTFSVYIYAYDVCVDGLYYNLKGNSAIVTHGVPRMSTSMEGDTYTQDTIIIPEKITSEGKEYTVTEVGDSAFFNIQGPVSHITVPSTVTRIGKSAFRLIYNLKTIALPSYLSEIGEEAFRNCSRLESIDIPKGITEIYPYTFAYLKKVKSLRIPDGVIKIGDGAFNGNYKIESISLPASLREIGKGVFSGCAFKDINIPEGVQSIGKYAFFYCNNLKSINLPSSVTYIGDSAFYECDSLETIVLPDNLEEVSNKLFYFCFQLKSIVLPKNLKKIGDWAFNCCAIKEIVIPSSVTSIGEKAFCNCLGLKVIYNYVTDPITLSGDICTHYNTLHVLKGCGEKYKVAATWNKFTIVEDLEPTGISQVKANTNAKEAGCYDLQGRKIAQPKRGLNIIRYKDGTTRKVMK